MKKKMIIAGALCLVVLIVVVVLLLLNRKNSGVATLTMDINPSIEIKLKKEKVTAVKALNEDGEKVIEKVEDDMSLEEAMNEIINKSFDYDFIRDDVATILVHVDGKLDMDELQKVINGPVSEKNHSLDLIVIDKITNEDKDLAKEYDISPAKAAYINKIAKEKNMDVEYFVNRSIREIKETEASGNRCEEGWELRDGWCFKEKAREEAKKGKVCPGGYIEHDGKCYEEGRPEETEEYECAEGRTLNGDKCIREEEKEPVAKSFTCSSGELTKKSDIALATPGEGDGYICVDKSKATHPMSPCELHDGTETTMSGGKCYWHRAPVIAEGCPGKIQIGHMCWDDASNVLVCKGARDGKQYSSRNEYCENSITYTDPVVSEYTCEGEYTMKGTKCVKEEEEPAQRKMACPSGYTKVDHDRCINETKTVELTDGYVCDKEDSEVRGDTCILFEKKEALHD